MSSNGVSVSWQERAANKRRDCANKIPEEWKIPAQLLAELEAPVLDKKNDLIRGQTIRKSGILTDRELSITEDYQVADLISALADGSLTAVEVTLAYSKRAALAQQLVCRALELDLTSLWLSSSFALNWLRLKANIATGGVSNGNNVRRSTRARLVS